MADRVPGALDVVGRVMVEMGGESTRIIADGDRIIVELPGLRSAASVLRLREIGGGRRDSIPRIHDALSAAGLTLEVVVAGSTVGLLGVGARAGAASRLFGFGPLEIRVRGLLGPLVRRAGRAE